MALLNAIVLPSKTIKGGKNKVRISVAHNGDTRYIVTDIILDSNKEFKNGKVVKRPDAAMLNTKIRSLLQRYQHALDDLEYINGLSCPELLYLIRTADETKHRTLKSIFEEYIHLSNIRNSTANSYKIVWSNIENYFGDKFFVEHINHGKVIGFDKYLRDKGLKPHTICNYMTVFMFLVKFAKKCGYVQYRVDPFFGYKLPSYQARDSWLSVDEVRRIRDIKSTKKNILKCRDMFMLSYYLGGINMNDLLDINFNEQKDVIKYIRKKTADRPKQNKYVEFVIPKEAKKIIDRWRGRDGHLDVSNAQRKNIMHSFFQVNMPLLAKLTGINNLIYYSARKSFSQHAFNLGISTSVIDYILGHRVDKGGSSLYNYISVTPEMASDAVRKVLDNLK